MKRPFCSTGLKKEKGRQRLGRGTCSTRPCLSWLGSRRPGKRRSRSVLDERVVFLERNTRERRSAKSTTASRPYVIWSISRLSANAGGKSEGVARVHRGASDRGIEKAIEERREGHGDARSQCRTECGHDPSRVSPYPFLNRRYKRWRREQ